MRDNSLKAPPSQTELLMIVPSQSGPVQGEAVWDYFRAYLRQVVGIHQTMFEKLLSDEGELPLELAELFKDAGDTYIRISERMNEDFLSRRGCDVE